MKPGGSKEIRKTDKEVHEYGPAFAMFRLPHTSRVQRISGAVSRSIGDGQAAFAFAPFDSDRQPYYIIPDSRPATDPYTPLPKTKKLKSTTRREYTALVKKITGAIRQGDIKKVVAARLLAIDRPASFDPDTFFQRLCELYHSAFVSLVYIQGEGLWIGASPEVLVSERPGAMTVYSLAGTKEIEDQAGWDIKELEEQSIVTDFIRRKLSKISDGKITEKGPVTRTAGMVKHLLTVFTLPLRGRSLWQQAAKVLHPTPAVGGSPRKKSIALIQKQESFDRRYYAGYLGPVNIKKRTDLFVNLRCMQVTDSQLLFYAGCGVTGGSDPDHEWMESERKIDILKSLL